jgi:ADP-heptose:LPS heptosyltransferase
MANILVIKHGALGDFVMASGAFAAIRRHHDGDHLTLMTTAPFADLARASKLFDEVVLDDRPRAWQLAALWRLRQALVAPGFERVYDLQTSDRTGFYFRLLPKPRPLWSGIAAGCSHPHRTAHRGELHTIDRLAEQLTLAGIGQVPPPSLDWLRADLGRFRLPAGIALLVAGGAPHRPEKRWPVERFGELARALTGRDIVPLLLGTEKERAAMAAIAATEPRARNLCGKTSFAEVAALARRAAVAVGNDTGPMHLAAIVGCPCVVLFSAASDPKRTAPRGRDIAILQVGNLATLAVADVLGALDRVVRPTGEE